MSQKTVKRLRAELKRTTTLLSYLCICFETKQPFNDEYLKEVFKWWNEYKQSIKNNHQVKNPQKPTIISNH